uniref:Uncharacterized protein n=1 Tax=Strongyloides stercoralis TaxID=6248 RepID=A0A0K0DUK7_STRER
MDGSKTPAMEYSPMEDVQFTTPKSVHKALNGKVVKTNTRSRLRKTLANPRKLFDGKSIARNVLFAPDASERAINKALECCNITTESQSKTNSCNKEEDNEFIDLRCTETFLDEPTYGKSLEGGNIDQLNNLLNYMEDLSTKDLNDTRISFRKNCTPPSRAGERRKGVINFYNDGSGIKKS